MKNILFFKILRNKAEFKVKLIYYIVILKPKIFKKF
jgi:hypothetical protein